MSVTNPGGRTQLQWLGAAGAPRPAAQRSLRHSSLTVVSLSQVAGLLTYLFCGLFGSGSFVINFVAIALLQAADFWFVKVCRLCKRKQSEQVPLTPFGFLLSSLSSLISSP